MSKLRPCPFCGGEAVNETFSVRKGFESNVCCNSCLAMVHTITHDDYEKAKEQAIKAWNKRAILSVPDTKAEWLKKQENLDGTITYECSNCEHEKKLAASPWHYDVYYCEACGADMGLDDNDEVI